ncbi:MAG: carbon storage regulator CsrA [Bacillota bacterium]
MLVLTRKVNQKILIDERIWVTILEIDGDKIKLGIEAPKEVPVLRMELYEAVKQENMEAIQAKLGIATQLSELPKPEVHRDRES